MSNKTFDYLGLIAEDEAVTATATCTPVEIKGLNLGSAAYHVAVNTSATTGTVDASHYYTIGVYVSDLTGGTYTQIGQSVTPPPTAGIYEFVFTSEQIEDYITGADFFKVTATKVGTTATAVTYTAFISKV